MYVEDMALEDTSTKAIDALSVQGEFVSAKYNTLGMVHKHAPPPPPLHQKKAKRGSFSCCTAENLENTQMMYFLVSHPRHPPKNTFLQDEHLVGHCLLMGCTNFFLDETGRLTAPLVTLLQHNIGD